MELSHLTYFSPSDSNTIERKVERFFFQYGKIQQLLSLLLEIQLFV